MQLCDKKFQLFTAGPDAFAYHRIITDETGRAVDYVFVEVNQAFLEVMNRSRDQVIGKRVTEVLPGIEHGRFDWIGTYGVVALQGESTRLTQYSEFLDDWFEITAFSDEAGYFATVFRSVKNEVQLREELSSAHRQLEALFASIPDALIVANADSGTVEMANHRAEELFGRPVGELAGLHQSELHPREDYHSVRNGFTQAVENQHEDMLFETRILRADGSTVPVEINTLRSVFELGEERYVLGVFRDIRKRVADRQELIQARDRSRSHEALAKEAERIAKLGYYEVDHQRNTVHWSDGAFAIFGVDPESFSGRYQDLQEYLTTESWQEMDRQFRAHLEHGSEYNLVLHAVTPSGITKYVHASCDTTRDEAGRPRRTLGVVLDITDRVRSEQRLQAQEAKWRSYIQNAPYGVVIVNRRGIIVDLNPTACSLTGYPEKRLLGTHAARLVSSNERNAEFGRLYKRFRGNSVNEVVVDELRYRTQDGRERWWSIAARQLEDGRFLVFLEDITDRKEMDEALQNREEFLWSILESQQSLIVRVDMQNRLTFVNDSYCRTFGKTREELIGSEFAPLIHEDDRQPTLDAMKQLDKPPHRVYIEQRAQTTAGWRWIAWEDIGILDEQGELSEIHGVGRDITRHKAAELELKEKRKQVEAITAGARDAIILIDPDRRVTFWNPAAERMLGYSEADVMGRVLGEVLVAPANKAGIDQLLDRAGDRSTAGPGDALYAIDAFELELHTKLGDSVTVELSLSSIAGADGRHVLALLRDVTERRQAERDRIARNSAEAANQAKSSFLAKMSHEIRTPLNAILGFSNILMREPSLGTKQLEQVRTIARGSRHLMTLISDVLDLSKIEADRMTVDPRAMDLRRMLHDLELMFRPRVEAKGVKLKTEIAAPVPRTITADQTKLSQILMNLLGNAVKFTDHGEISVRVFMADAAGGDDDEAGEGGGTRGGDGNGNNATRPSGHALPVDHSAPYLAFELHDTGVGIPAEDTTRVFDMFMQSAAGVERTGSGLGLPISKRLVELMGGRIGLQSRPGKGSIFWFTLPLTGASETTEAPELDRRRVTGLQPGTQPPRILVVDDNRDNRVLLRDLLEPIGFSVCEAENGRDALRAIKTCLPSAVLMDMRMPVMDGYQATRQLKGREDCSRIPVIAIAAGALEEDERHALNAGADAYIRKPFEESQVLAALAQLLDLRYLYAEDPVLYHEGESAASVTADDIAGLPPELRESLLLQVETGDMSRFKTLVSEIEADHPQVASELLRLAAAYDYTRLTELLGQQGTHEQGADEQGAHEQGGCT